MLRLLVVNVVAAWTYPIAAQVLRSGSLDPAGAQQLMLGNRLRLGVIFFVLTVALYQLRVLIRPATSWMLRALVDKELVWTPQEAAFTYLIDFPFDVLWSAVWAVTIAVVIKDLPTPLETPWIISAPMGCALSEEGRTRRSVR